MFKFEHFEGLAQKLYDVLPDSVQTFEHEIQEKFQDILQSAFSNMNLVTREEFDVQIKVLARTREKVEALQKQLDDLLSEKEMKS